jgi:hypothetical protein
MNMSDRHINIHHLKVPPGEEEVVPGLDYGAQPDLGENPTVKEMERAAANAPGPMRRSFMRWQHKHLVVGEPVTCAVLLEHRLSMLKSLGSVAVIDEEGKRVHIGNNEVRSQELMRWNKWSNIEKLRLAAGTRTLCAHEMRLFQARCEDLRSWLDDRGEQSDHTNYFIACNQIYTRTHPTCHHD